MKSILTVPALEAKLKPNLFYILYQQYIIMTNLFKSLYFQVLIAIAIGIALGHFYPAFAVQLKPPGDGFIKFIR